MPTDRDTLPIEDRWAIGFMLCLPIALMALAGVLFAQLDFEPPAHYGIVIDAGSSG